MTEAVFVGSNITWQIIMAWAHPRTNAFSLGLVCSKVSRTRWRFISWKVDSSFSFKRLGAKLFFISLPSSIKLRQGNVSHSVHRGERGVCQTLPDQTPPRYRHPLCRHLPAQYMLGYTPPPTQHMLGYIPPTPQWPRQRTVRILLECILVCKSNWNRFFSWHGMWIFSKLNIVISLCDGRYLDLSGKSLSRLLSLSVNAF